MNAPSGLVTFLYTDIEGSTKLAQKFPESYPPALNKHNLILRNIIEENNGFVFKTVGDAFCVGFGSDKDAVNAALSIQHKLCSEFKDEIKIKIRMGIHKGEAEFVNGDYIGYVTLSRVQRLMSIGHGGQILITKEIYDNIRKGRNEYIFRDFGQRKLKDIIKSEHVYQISSGELQNEFPPLKTIDARQNNLPVYLTKFIGRKKEISDLKILISGSRLISLTGPGGTGKTRLAINLLSGLLDEYENGIWLIELSPIANPEIIVNEISAVFGLKEDPGTDLLETLKFFLKDKKTILLLDNSEHLIEKCASVAESLLKSCPGLKIIATSRESFNLSGEAVYKIPPLALPENTNDVSAEILSEYESVKLFIDRAKSVNPGFITSEKTIKTIAELCRHLDGIPLAIELAAKRINVLSVEKILDRLSDRFKLLTGGSPTSLPRQKTLKALIDWSYDLLNFKEQLLLQRLSVFQGGWTLEASEEICSDDEIKKFEILDLTESLHNKSLIFYSEENGIKRFGLLETIRFYSFEKLQNKIDIFQKKIDYYIRLTDYKLQRVYGIGQIEWMNIVKTEIDNIRISISKSLELSLKESAELVLNMFQYWIYRGNYSESIETITKVFESEIPFDELTKGKLMENISELSYFTGNFNLLEKYANESVEIFKKHDYKDGIIAAFRILGMKSYIESDNNKAKEYCEKALMLCGDEDTLLKADVLSNYSVFFSSFKKIDKCVNMKMEALKIVRKEMSPHFEAFLLSSISVVLSRFKNSGKNTEALQYAEESLAISVRLEDNYLKSINLVQIGSIKLLEEKDYDNAEYLFLEAYKLIKDFGYYMNFFPLLIYIGTLYNESGKPETALKFYQEYFQNRGKSGSEYFIKDVVLGLAKTYFLTSDYFRSAKYFGLFDSLKSDPKYKKLVSIVFTYEKDKSELVHLLGKQEFKRLFEEGKVMTLDEVEELEMN